MLNRYVFIKCDQSVRKCGLAPFVGRGPGVKQTDAIDVFVKRDVRVSENNDVYVPVFKGVTGPLGCCSPSTEVPVNKTDSAAPKLKHLFIPERISDIRSVYIARHSFHGGECPKLFIHVQGLPISGVDNNVCAG